jgi:hypothetical protein
MFLAIWQGERRMRCNGVLYIVALAAAAFGCGQNAGHNPPPAPTAGVEPGKSNEVRAGITDEQLILKWRSRKVTTEEVEAAEDSPKASKEWATFKEKMKPGDERWYFCSPRPTWEQLMGQEGYAIFRGNKLVDQYTTRMN